jgi:hypothetical protein
VVAEQWIVDGGEVLKVVIPAALRRTSAEVTRCDRLGNLTRTKVRESWINCLRDAFGEMYPSHCGSQRIAVFGGTPRPMQRKEGGVPTGIPGWSRWEFLHDVAVVEWEMTEAAFARDLTSPSDKRPVPVVTRAIWQVESELAGDGTKVAEDASKLRVCLADNKLLVASFTGRIEQERWLNFLARTMSGTDGSRFIAIVPNYGRTIGYEQWKQQSVPFKLYRCGPNPGDVDSLLCSGEP